MTDAGTMEVKTDIKTLDDLVALAERIHVISELISELNGSEEQTPNFSMYLQQMLEIIGEQAVAIRVMAQKVAFDGLLLNSEKRRRQGGENDH
jgi:hypothetical protein